MRYAVACLASSVLLTLTGSGCTAESPAGAEPTATSVTVRHALGTTVVPRPPRRVVTLGPTDTQVALALGVPLVAAVRNPLSRDGNWPGVSPPLPAEVATLDDDVPELEHLAALRPDLILAVSAKAPYLGIYDTLSRIAPVIGGTGARTESGEELTRTIGRALFRDAEAEALIAASDAAVDRYAADHPELDGATYALGPFFGGHAYVDATPGSRSHQLLHRLGLELTPELTAVARKGPMNRTPDGLAVIGAENLDLLGTADLTLIGTWGAGSSAGFLTQPVVVSSGLATSDRLRMIGTDLTEALLRPNPALTDYILGSLDRLRLSP